MNAIATLLRQAPEGARPVLRALAEAARRRRVFTLPDRSATACKVVVAVSGGADSVCLLHALHQSQAHLGLQLHVAHVDHALRPDSDQDALFVAEMAAQMEIPFHTTRLAPDRLVGRPEGVEAAARTARYTFLHQVACRLGGPDGPAQVAVAHHKHDQAETVLMNLVRGSGLSGLAGMAWRSWVPVEEDPKVQLVRPLLDVGRDEIRACLAAYALSWREDATNQDETFLRNQIRAVLLPSLTTLNPALVDTLARTADLLGAEAARAARLDRQAWEAVSVDPGELGQPPLCQVIDLARFGELDLATRRGVVRQALSRLGADLRQAGMAAVDRLLDSVADHLQTGGPYPLIDDLVWTILPSTGQAPPRLSLHLRTALPVVPPHPHLDGGWTPQPIPWVGTLKAGDWALASSLCDRADLPPDWRAPGREWRAFLDADQTANLVLTTSSPGLRMAPLGLEGHHRTVGDIFTDRKVPGAFRSGWPVVVDTAGQVVWLCGLTVGHSARITHATRTVRVLAWRPSQTTATVDAALDRDRTTTHEWIG